MIDIVLDRDGILNMDVGYTHKIEDLIIPAGTIEGLCLLRKHARFSIATGQSGIARGMYSEQALHTFNEKLLSILRDEGIPIAAVVHCPHHPEISGVCDCRKPKTGMLQHIDGQIGSIDWENAWGIGDKPADSEMILAMGGRAVLVESGAHNNSAGKVYWSKNDPKLTSLLENERHFTAFGVLGAAQTILREAQLEA